MDLLETKILAMVILGSVSFLLGLSTIKLRNLLGLETTGTQTTQKKVTSLLLCFGAGVLFATCLLHILPEMRHGVEEAEHSLGVSWLAELVLCSGFFLVYLLEEVVHLTLEGTKHTEQLHRTLSVRKSGVGKTVEDPNSFCNNGPVTGPTSCCKKEGENGSCCKKEGENEYHNDMEMNDGKDEVPGYNPKYEVRLSNSTSDMFPNYHSPESTVTTVTDEGKKGKRQSVTESSGNHHSHLMISPQSDSAFRDFLTVLALSFHAVFEGLALGLEEDNADVWALFAAISCHKFVITFCMSIELLQAGTKIKMFILYILTFSLVSPIGVVVGIIITEFSNTDSSYHELTVAILQGLAAGTILYVVMFEVLQRERSNQVPGLSQLLAIILGFGAMVLIEIFAQHEHDHEEHEEHEEHSDLTLNAALPHPVKSLGNMTFRMLDEFVPLKERDHGHEGHDHG